MVTTLKAIWIFLLLSASALAQDATVDHTDASNGWMVSFETVGTTHGFLVGTLLSILGIVLTVVIYFKQKAILRLSYKSREVTLGNEQKAAFGQHVKILHGDRVISQVTSSKFCIWNSGGLELRSEDVAAKAPLRLIVGEEFSILDVTLKSISREVIGASFSIIDSNTVSLDFDFLAKRDGFVVEVIHDGPEESVVFSGSLKTSSGNIKNVGKTMGDTINSLIDKSPLRAVLTLVAFGFPGFVGVWFAYWGYTRPDLHAREALLNQTFSYALLFYLLTIIVVWGGSVILRYGVLVSTRN